MKIKIKNKFVIIDDENYDFIKNHKWHIHSNNYIHNNKVGYLHRLLVGAKKTLEYVDHINGNKFDNRMSNLRICTPSQSARNVSKTKKKCTSQYKGVDWNIKGMKWRSICGGKYLGYYDSEIEAAKAYNEAAKILFGEYAKLNQIINGYEDTVKHR